MRVNFNGSENGRKKCIQKICANAHTTSAIRAFVWVFSMKIVQTREDNRIFSWEENVCLLPSEKRYALANSDRLLFSV